MRLDRPIALLERSKGRRIKGELMISKTSLD